MTLTLFHTSPAHLDRFETLRARLAPDTEIIQIVREDWLERARKSPDGMDDALATEITDAIKAATGPALCTCTTIGPVAEDAGALRIDWPMMQDAAQTGGPILLAYALDSTWLPSMTLLERALAELGQETTVHPMPLLDYWPLFEAGQQEAFNAVIAAEIRQIVAGPRPIACVVLAQASMAGAADLLADLTIPVLCSPELAFRAALSRL